MFDIKNNDEQEDEKIFIDLSGLSQFHGGLPYPNVIILDLFKKAKIQETEDKVAETSAVSALVLATAINIVSGYSLS